jgi:hypothetical protein
MGCRAPKAVCLGAHSRTLRCLDCSGTGTSLNSAHPQQSKGSSGDGMRLLVRLGYALGVIVLAGLTAPAAQAAYSGHQDPVWPCMAIKVPDLSLAAVRAGRPVDAYMKTWSQDQELATLADRLAQRRLPLNEAEAEVTAFAKELGQDLKPQTACAYGRPVQSAEWRAVTRDSPGSIASARCACGPDSPRARQIA